MTGNKPEKSETFTNIRSRTASRQTCIRCECSCTVSGSALDDPSRHKHHIPQLRGSPAQGGKKHGALFYVGATQMCARTKSTRVLTNALSPPEGVCFFACARKHSPLQSRTHSRRRGLAARGSVVVIGGARFTAHTRFCSQVRSCSKSLEKEREELCKRRNGMNALTARAFHLRFKTRPPTKWRVNEQVLNRNTLPTRHTRLPTINTHTHTHMKAHTLTQ